MLNVIADTVNVKSFQTFAIVFSTSENLIEGICGVLGMERKPLSMQKYVLWKCCGLSQIQWMRGLSNLCHCVQHSWKLTNRYYWSCKKESKPLSMLKYVLWKCCGVSQKWWMQELSNLCHCVQHSWHLTSRDDCNTRNERKALFQQKSVLRKCCKVSQKQSILELFKLLSVVFSTHDILTSSNFWSSRKLQWVTF